MIKPDVIVTWPRNADYPLWRQYIRDNRSRFNNVIIVWHETNQGEDYRKFVEEAMFPDYCHFVTTPPVPSGEDWRNHSIRFGLMHSLHAEWIYFTEQDFYTNEGFWEEVEEAEHEGCEVIHASADMRMHPCCIFIKRTLLEQTHKDFSARPDEGYDHFGRLQKDLMRTSALAHTVDPKSYKHYNGLSHNFTLISNGGHPNYEPKDFIDYLTQCVQVQVPLDSRFINTVANYLTKLDPEQGMALLQPK